MSPQSLLRASPRMANIMGRRMFHATRPRMTSPYHYPEGPYSNLPFNTKTKYFAVRYWLYMITGFFAPFGIAGASFPLPARGIPGCFLLRASGSMIANSDVQSGKPTSPRHKQLAWELIACTHGGFVGAVGDRWARRPADGSCTYMRTIELEANRRNAFPYVNFHQTIKDYWFRGAVSNM